MPRDLTEATLAGGTISLVSSIVMAYLFITNFSAFLSVDTKTSIVLDASTEKKLQINFNVTIHHLPCRFASLDIVDVMGTHLQNVSANIVKTRVDAQVAAATARPFAPRHGRRTARAQPPADALQTLRSTPVLRASPRRACSSARTRAWRRSSRAR